MLRQRVCYGVGLAVCFVVVRLANSADPVPPPFRGPFDVGYEAFTFTEPGVRDVEGFLWYPGDPTDTGDTSITYPFFGTNYESPFIGGRTGVNAAPDGPFPLVVLDHGASAFALQFAKVAESLASHGFVVAAPQREESDGPTSAPLYQASVGTVDYVVRRSLASNDSLSGAVDADAMAFGGYSLGGRSSSEAFLNFSPSRQALIRFDTANLVEATRANQITSPTLSVSGGNTNTDFLGDSNRLRFSDPMNGVEIDNVHHWSFGLQACQFNPNQITGWLGCDPSLRPPDEVQEISAQHMVAFLKLHLQEDNTYLDFLDPGPLADAVEIQASLRARNTTDLLLTDPLGRRIGMDPASGQIVNDIGGATSYTGGRTHLFHIPAEELLPGEYILTGMGNPGFPDDGLTLHTWVTTEIQKDYGDVFRREIIPERLVKSGEAFEPLVFTIVPEPSSSLLALIGALAMGSFRFKREDPSGLHSSFSPR